MTRREMRASTMIFAFGFRTFFLLAGLAASLLVPLWMAFLFGLAMVLLSKNVGDADTEQVA